MVVTSVRCHGPLPSGHYYGQVQGYNTLVVTHLLNTAGCSTVYSGILYYVIQIQGFKRPPPGGRETGQE